MFSYPDMSLMSCLCTTYIHYSTINVEERAQPSLLYALPLLVGVAIPHSQSQLLKTVATIP